MGLFDPDSDTLHVDPRHQPLMRVAGLDARAVIDDPRIHAWRRLADRENCTFDTQDADGLPVRLHVKRYMPSSSPTPAELEQAGYQLVVDAGIATAPLVAWGKLTDGRSFTIWLDLAGFVAGDKFVTSAETFEACLTPTAETAGRLHKAGLHHRDLYLCHFMIQPRTHEVSLIDTARVRRLPGFLTRRRWIVKDLAQFWYSTTKHPITDEQRERWLAHYCKISGARAGALRRSILRKVRAIARHDISLNRREPTRNVSLGEASRS